MRTFLSSTYIDLVEHRRAATEALERLGQSVDRMEIFGARPEEPTTACMAEVDNSDLFVGIYAHRYGSLVPNSTRSVTEEEFHRAAAVRKPSFCFVVADDHPWPPKMIEDEPGRDRLIQFKRLLNATVVRETFTTPENLGFKVATSVGKYIASMLPSHAGASLILDIGSVRGPGSQLTFGEVRFTVTNVGQRPVKIPSLVLVIECREPLDQLQGSIIAGPIEERFLYARITESSDLVDVLPQHYLVQPAETDGFFLKLDGPEGFRVKMHLVAHCHFLGEGDVDITVSSRSFAIDFPSRSSAALLKIARARRKH